MPPPIAPKRRDITQRKRRAHAKSKSGCENCKLRRVKCDETKPQCNRCRSYGVSCNLAGSKASLDVAAQGSFQVYLATSVVDGVPGVQKASQGTGVTSGPSTFAGVVKTSAPIPDYNVTSGLNNPWSHVSANDTMVAMISDSLRSAVSSQHVQMRTEAELFPSGASWQFSESHLEILTRFQSRTALTIGDYRMAHGYRDIVCHLALQHPFLMHMVIGITLMHDSDLSLTESSTVSKRQQHLSLLHWDLATTLFQRILSQPLPPAYRDAMWATGVHLGAASFWYVESSDEGAVWPLKPTEPSDFAWMKIGKGKTFLWRVADPMRKDGMFHEVLKKRPFNMSSPWEDGQDNSFIPEKMKSLFGIDNASTKENNAYLVAVAVLSRIRHLTLTHANALDFLHFTSFITPSFIALLEEKDQLAVFLLGWWLSLVKRGDLWWMVRRARIQGEAVRIWLMRENEELADLLDEIGRESERLGAQRILCSLAVAG